MRYAESRELPSEARPLLGGGVGEALAQLPLGRVDVELAPGLRVDEPDVADVRQLLLARVADLDRDDRVPGGDSEHRRPPVARAAEVGDDDGERALPCDPGDLREGGPDRGRPDTLGLRLTPHCEQDTEQADPSLPRPQQHGFVPAEGRDADPVATPRGQVAQRDGDALGDVPLAAVGGAEPHGRGDVEQHPRGERPLGDVHAHLHLVRAGRGVPVDPADVVARLPLADLRELGADADRRGPVLAGQQAVDAPPDLHVERPKEGLRHRPGTGTVRRPLSAEGRNGHAARNESSISGTGTTSRTEETIESAPTSAASAS